MSRRIPLLHESRQQADSYHRDIHQKIADSWCVKVGEQIMINSRQGFYNAWFPVPNAYLIEIVDLLQGKGYMVSVEKGNLSSSLTISWKR